ncbi:flavin reductase family protein [Variovorax saccharolyticus]|uniref:flavin reductase family protein n=1 Tax=Variovorax saccharolyticus TaxID=3053516 RepID=UPI0025769F2F|nr:flavin reductase family protein [Variovorax sp. J22R187]MDM0021899.1 flavin reductase family protein [Variovorax sp. J22R187]
MYYEPGVTDHHLPFRPFKSCVVPRPIGWISTLSKDGIGNLAPYSQFQNVSYDPPMVLFSANRRQSGEPKDTVRNAQDSGEFVWNMATFAQRDAVNRSSQDYPFGVDEMEKIGLERLPSTLVKPARVADSPVHFECRYMQTVSLPGNGAGAVDVVFGRVIGIHIDDRAFDAEGRIDIVRLRPLARLGYLDYTSVESKFTMVPPHRDPSSISDMEGPQGAQRPVRTASLA